MALPDRVREHAADVAAHARSVRIDLDALEALDPGAAARARPRAPLPRRRSARRRGLPPHARRDQLRLGLVSRRCASAAAPTGGRCPATSRSRGRWPTASARWGRGRAAELRAMRADEVADVLGQAARSRADGALRPGAARARPLPRRASRARPRRRGRRSARSRSPSSLAAAWRCGTTAASPSARRSLASDLALAGVGRASTTSTALTIFADNLVPHVLRCEGVLVLRRRVSRRTSTPGACCARGRRSVRSGRAPSTRASRSRGAPP